MRKRSQNHNENDSDRRLMSATFRSTFSSSWAIKTSTNQIPADVKEHEHKFRVADNITAACTYNKQNAVVCIHVHAYIVIFKVTVLERKGIKTIFDN